MSSIRNPARLGANLNLLRWIDFIVTIKQRCPAL